EVVENKQTGVVRQESGVIDLVLHGHDQAVDVEHELADIGAHDGAAGVDQIEESADGCLSRRSRRSNRTSRARNALSSWSAGGSGRPRWAVRATGTGWSGIAAWSRRSGCAGRTNRPGSARWSGGAWWARWTRGSGGSWWSRGARCTSGGQHGPVAGVGIWLDTRI